MTSPLVVNADDAGMDPVRDAAILDCADRGLVRSASVVVGGPTAPAFVREALRRRDLGLGLHLNLSEGLASAGRAFTLTDARGAFLGDKTVVWARAVQGTLDPREVEAEVVAQWHRLRSLGAEPDHVDGHNHVHVLPCVADGLLAALARLRARVFVRVPAEGDPPHGTPPVASPAIPLGTTVLSRLRLAQVRAGHGGLAAVGAHADAFRRRLRGDLRATDGFLGIALGQEPTLARLEAGLRAAGPGVVEVMVHPGRMAALGGPAFGDPRRDDETRLLTDPAARAAVAAAGFTLASFRELLA